MIITTKYGKIEGITENGCQVFKGVPYAKPPVGELRFHKPQELESWEGIYHAYHYGNKSMQGPVRPGFYLKEFYSNPEFNVPESEDCLYMNIWVPEHLEHEKLPVAVYVHGGAFMGGAGSNLPFVCENLAKAGVIVVTFNYRLGALGFLCHPLLAVEGENVAGGNYGLWDQLQAFRWVKENIENFGGDADRITAFGQSAGAMSLQILALAQPASEAFERMILQSGGGYHNPLAEYRHIERAWEIAEWLLEMFGIHDQEWKISEEKRQEALHLLYDTPVEAFMEAVGHVIARSFKEGAGIPFVPVIDGELLENDGDKLIEQGKYHAIPYIIGANGNDMTTEETSDPTPENNLMHIGDVAYANMVNSKYKDTAYVYYFDRKLPGDDAGAFHSAELWYVFGSLNYCWRPMEKADYELSKKMITYWSNFIKTGDPNQPDQVNEWKPCTKEDSFYKVFE